MTFKDFDFQKKQSVMTHSFGNISFRTKRPSFEKARLGQLSTPRGIINTPFFYCCATRGAIKALAPQLVDHINVEAILCNSYHLLIHPGQKILKNIGLHKFTCFDKPIMTDSGGYQVFSMGHGRVSSEIKGKRPGKNYVLKISDKGVNMRSYRNGEIVFLSPEIMMDFQCGIGADFCVQFDQCTPYNMSYEETKNALRRTMLWGDQSLEYFEKYRKKYKYDQALYGVMQGGVYKDLRASSAEYLLSRPFFGIAIGGSLGSTESMMYETVRLSVELLSNSLIPIHLLGVGKVKNILSFVPLGVDTFDCVYPTRLARHGSAIVKGRKNSAINLYKSKYKDDQTLLDPTYKTVSATKAYIHHLLKTSEMSAYSVLTYHNAMQMNRLMSEIRMMLSIADHRREWDDFARLWDPTLTRLSNGLYVNEDDINSKPNLYDSIPMNLLPKDFFEEGKYQEKDNQELYDLNLRLDLLKKDRLSFFIETYFKDKAKK